jgi:hypothetical protein
MGGQDDSITHIPSSWMQGSLSGGFPLLGDLSLIISDDLNGAWRLAESNDNAFSSPLSTNTRGLPFRELTTNPSNEGYVGLRFKGLDVGYRNMTFIGSDSIMAYMPKYFGFLDSNSVFLFDYRRLVRHVFEGQFNLENSLLILDLSTRYFLTENRIDSLVQDTTTWAYDSVQGTARYFDQYFYSTIRTGVHIPALSMNVSVGTTLLNHVLSTGFYDTYNYFYLIDGNLDIADNRLAYQLLGNHQNLEKSPFETGFYQTIYLRDSYTLARGLFLKVLAINTISFKLPESNFWKQRYDIGVRKTWLTGSYADVGYFTVIGNWYPKAGLYGRALIRLNEQFGISLYTRALWAWRRDYTHPSVLGAFIDKFGNGAEVSYRISKPVELLIGGNQINYNQELFDHDQGLDFPSRYSVYCGVRVCQE